MYVTKLSCLFRLWPVICMVALSPHTRYGKHKFYTNPAILQNGKSILQGFQKKYNN